MDYALQREKIQKAVDEAALMFEGCGLDVSKEVWANENTISEDEKEVVYVCGAVCISCPGASADDALFLDIDTTLAGDDVDEKAVAFLERAREISTRLKNSDNKAEELKAVNKEIDEKLAEDIRALNKAVNGNLKAAIGAAAALLVFALVLIAIRYLT